MNELLALLKNVLPLDGPQIKRLVRLPDDRPIIYVGDTHGDRDAVASVFSRFSVPSHVIVFLGDTVDRGPDSIGTLKLVLERKREAPSSIHLLMGNHEAWGVSQFSPADFWQNLTVDQADRCARHLMTLPLAAWHPSGTLATHGGLPNLRSLDAMDDIELGSEAWRAITWGDWVSDRRFAGRFEGRPSFGPTTFEERSFQLGVKVLIRSHQPMAPLYLFDDRCLTLFTSIAYGGTTRRVARLLPDQQIKTARDLNLIEV